MFKKIESRTATAGGGVASFFSRKRLVTDPCTHFSVGGINFFYNMIHVLIPSKNKKPPVKADEAPNRW